MSLLGIDVGTTGCKAVAFSESGELLASSYHEYDVARELPGQAELDCEEVWRKTKLSIKACVAKTSTDPVRAISATSMGEALVPVDASGNVCGRSVLSQDSRGARYVEDLSSKIAPEELYRITGNLPGAGFSLPLLCRLRDEEPALYEKTSKFIPWADFIAFKLCGEATANRSLASRTLLYDLAARKWSGRVANAAGLDLEKLPRLVQTGVDLGPVLASAAAELGLPSGVRIVSGGHDQCSAALGAGVGASNSAMLGLGTFACAVVVHKSPGEGSPLRKLSLNVEDHALDGSFVSFVYHGSGGALLKWLRDEIFRDLKGSDAYARMFKELDSASNSSRPSVLPFFAPSGPLACADGGQGAFCGLSLSTSRSDLLRAALEGIAFYFRDAFLKLSNAGFEIDELRVSGGGSESDRWLEMISGILEKPLLKPACKECGSLGSAMTAGFGSGLFGSFAEAASAMAKPARRFEPRDDARAVYEKAFERYHSFAERLILTGAAASRLKEA